MTFQMLRNIDITARWLILAAWAALVVDSSSALAEGPSLLFAAPRVPAAAQREVFDAPQFPHKHGAKPADELQNTGAEVEDSPTLTSQPLMAERTPEQLPFSPPPILSNTVQPAAEQLQTQAWWEQEISASISPGQPALNVDLNALLQLTISCSEQVKAVGVNRWIQSEQTIIAQSEFDTEAYADGRFDDTSDPVGNTLTTGGPSRLNDHRALFEAGLRRKTVRGSSVSLSQQFGHNNSNSLFFIPNDQGTARMSLELRQPLLEGRGKAYNQSFVVSTIFQTKQAEAEYLVTLQSRLAEVGTAYWTLYRERATLLQLRRHVQRAAGISEELEKRQVFDALRSQVLRAKAAVATRNSELAVAEAELRNSQSRIRALINSPSLQCEPMPELVPVQPPPTCQIQTNLSANLSAGMHNRPEMRALAAQLQAAEIRTSQATNEVLPSLDLVLESYLSGLEGDSNVGSAWSEQFNEGAPSYAVGLQFSTPLGNRAAQARLRQRQYDQARVRHLLKDQSDVIRSEVEIATRNVDAAFQTIRSRLLAVEAVNAEMEYLNERWQRLRGDPNLGQLQLDDLLNAQVRLFEEERALVAAQAAYGTALLELQRVSGALVSAVSPRH